MKDVTSYRTFRIYLQIQHIANALKVIFHISYFIMENKTYKTRTMV
nr:MAG TPA: hypothetical protein [Caudoviricetes sp.]